MTSQIAKSPVSSSRRNLQLPSEAIIAAMTSVKRTLNIEQRGLEQASDALSKGLASAIASAAELIDSANGTTIVTGMGKSGHIGCKLAATLASTGTYSHFVHPAEASHGDLGMIRGNDVVLAISWSGETPELSDLIEHTRRFHIPLIAMTSRPESALARAADVSMILPIADEACPNGLAPTTSTTMQLVIGDALAILLLERRGFSASDFHRYHPGGKLGARLTQVQQIMHRGEKLPLVSETSTLSASIVEMTSKGFGISGVVSPEGKLVGVLSDGDLRRAFAHSFTDRAIGPIMSRDPYTVKPTTLSVEALAQMNDAGITAIFVVDAGLPLGLVHVHDLLRLGLV